MKLYPSLLASNLLKLEKTLVQLRDECDGFHVDIMDGHFVPNLGMSLELINKIASVTPLPLWTHIMTTNPQLAISMMKIRAGDIITFHYEAVTDELLESLSVQVRASGGLCSLALKPETPITVLESRFSLIDHVVIMCVNPGFSGQSFDEGMLLKLTQARTMIDLRRVAGEKPCLLAADGGIDLAILPDLLKIAVDHVALGSSLFWGGNPVDRLILMKKLIS